MRYEELILTANLTLSYYFRIIILLKKLILFQS